MYITRSYRWGALCAILITYLYLLYQPWLQKLGILHESTEENIILRGI